jgi:hypothetical protein
MTNTICCDNVISGVVLIEKIKSISGTTMASIVVETIPDIKNPKTSGMTDRLRKRSYVSITLGFNYSNSVNRQRTKEGVEPDFEALPRKWGTRIPKTSLVEHKGELYLETKINRVIDTKYILDGQEVQYGDIEQYLRAKPQSSGRQGVNNEIILRDYKLSSIVAITMFGQTYIVR